MAVFNDTIFPNRFGNLFCEKLCLVVAVTKAENEEHTVVIVGHVPRKISAACLLFLGRQGSSIICTVCGVRRYSSDLPQGGLEVPCKLTFKGSKLNVDKMKKILTGTSSTTSTSTDTCASSPPSKRRKIVECDSVTEKSKQWVVLNRSILTQTDRVYRIRGKLK